MFCSFQAVSTGLAYCAATHRFICCFPGTSNRHLASPLYWYIHMIHPVLRSQAISTWVPYAALRCFIRCFPGTNDHAMTSPWTIQAAPFYVVCQSPKHKKKWPLIRHKGCCALGLTCWIRLITSLQVLLLHTSYMLFYFTCRKVSS